MLGGVTILLPGLARLKELKVGVGDRLDFVLDREGRVVVQPTVRDVGELKGLRRKAGRKPVSIEQMNAVIVRQGRQRR